MGASNNSALYAIMAKPVPIGVDGKFYCNRLSIYTTKAECVERVRVSKENKKRPCCECAKGSLWLSKTFLKKGHKNVPGRS